MIDFENVTLKLKSGRGVSVFRDDAKDTILSNVNIKICRGDRVGLIGGNGTGKSTFLRLCAGNYEPTSGSISRLGRTLSLMDLSLGMDENLSGDKNIEIACATLKLTEYLTPSLKSEIIEFADIGQRIEQPLKIYSSGMRLRLAFSIITSFKADILLIDEIIGVGDMQFIDKANERLMQTISRSGGLVLASHTESVIRQFCDKAILFREGEQSFSMTSIRHMQNMADEKEHKRLKKKSRPGEDNAPRKKVRAGANMRKKMKQEREVDKDRLRILLLCDYNSTGAPTVIEHINSFYKYSRHEICILSGLIQNQGNLPTLFEKGKAIPFDLDNFDILIIHYSMTLSIDSYISQETKRRIRSFRGLKGLFLQDEYRFVDKTIATIKDLGFSIIFSCIPEGQMEQVYPKALLPGVTVVNVLTGYAPFSLNFFKTKPLKDRKIDVCYRGRKYPYWHGRAGLEKWSIAEAFQKIKDA